MFWYWFDELCTLTEDSDMDDNLTIVNEETIYIWSSCPISLIKLVLYNTY